MESLNVQAGDHSDARSQPPRGKKLVLALILTGCIVGGFIFFMFGRASEPEVAPAKKTLALFVLSPLTLKMVDTFRIKVYQHEPEKIELYTQSDTLRCGQSQGLGGQLESMKQPCKVLLDDASEDPKSPYVNMFGDQFNQAWLSKEWADLIVMLKELRNIEVQVMLYPTQATKNPTMDKVLESVIGPHLKDFVKLDTAEKMQEWEQKNILEKYYLLWCFSKQKKIEPVYDLGTVVDYVLGHSRDPAVVEMSLMSQAQDVDWCVAAAPSTMPPYPEQYKGLEEFEMTYVDVHNDIWKDQARSARHCRGPRVREGAAMLDGQVKVAVPTEVKHFENWANGPWKKALEEVFAMKPGSSRPAPQIELPQTDALILQDTLDADNAPAVLYLLSKILFKSVELHLVDQLVNFATHKMAFDPAETKKVKPDDSKFAGLPMVSVVEDYDDRICNESWTRQGHPGKAWVQLNGGDWDMTDVYYHHFNGSRKTAWPQMFSKDNVCGGKITPLSQDNNTDDINLMRSHNMWRWDQWLRRFNLHSEVNVFMGDVVHACPMSQVLIPYTFYFFNHTAPLDSNDFVVSYETYADLEKEAAERKMIHDAVKANLTLKSFELSLLSSAFDQ